GCLVHPRCPEPHHPLQIRPPGAAGPPGGPPAAPAAQPHPGAVPPPQGRAPPSPPRLRSYSLKVEPAGHFINWQQDPFANYQARLVFPEPTREFKVTVDLVVEMAVYNPFDFFLEPSAEKFPFK